MYQINKFNFKLLFSVLIFTCFDNANAQNKITGKDRPNIIIIYTDDQDLEETGCYGGRVSTPNIDRLAKEGVRFTNYYPSSPVCTPSRYSLLTGKYASRSITMQKEHPTTGYPFVRWNTDIIKGETTIAHEMNKAGYQTGYVGKWHNWYKGHPPFSHVPHIADPLDPKIAKSISENYKLSCDYIHDIAGFESVSSIYSNNFKWLPITEKLMYHNQHWVTHGAIQFIEKNKDKPFLLYMATTLPHDPKASLSLKSDPRITPDGYKNDHLNIQPNYESIIQRGAEFKTTHSDTPDHLLDMIWLDDGIGAILDKLENLGIRDNTLIIFASDHESMGKMTLNRGRSPLLMSWRNHIPSGEVNDELVSNIDFFPTILDVSKTRISSGLKLDGQSLIPLLLNSETTSWRKSLYLEITYTRGIVTKDWKYIAIRYPEAISRQITPENRKDFNQEGTSYSVGSINANRVRYDSDKKFPGYYDYNQLYDINVDRNEQNNLAKNPKFNTKLKELQEELKRYSKELPHRFGEFNQ